MRHGPRPLTAPLVLLALVAGLFAAVPGRAVAALPAPTALAVTRLATTELTLTWAAVADAAGYQVSYSTETDFSPARQLSVTTAKATLTELAAGKTLHIRVRVVDARGSALSGYSTVLTTKPLPVATTPKSSDATGTTKPPTSLTVTSTSRSGLALSWKSVATAAAYRVKYSTKSSYAGAKYRVVSTNSVELTALASSRRYYVKVRVVTTADKVRSGYSATSTGTTRNSGSYPYLRPRTGAVDSVTGTTATLSWPSRGSGLTYRVRYATGSGSYHYVVAKSPTATINKLLPNTAYRVSVRVVNAKNTSTLSEYSATVSAHTLTVMAPLRVASYNVKMHNSFHGLPGEGTWLQRRAAVAALIKGQTPDVLALQEAQQSRIRNADGTLSKLAQMEDLVRLLGSSYKLANPYRYDCVKSTTQTGCVKKDRQASRGVRIVYNTAEVTLQTYGARRLSYVNASDMARYVSWAIFRQKDSGKSFVMVDVHLENLDDLVPGETAYYDNRKKQVREALAEVNAHNPDHLPVIFAGDLNTTKNSVPDNAPYDIMLAAGYTDPLGNTYRSTTIGPGATVEKRIRTEYNSYNRWLITPPKSSNPNGSYFDYIFTSGPFRVSEWETAMKLDAAGNFSGVIPSDHHLIRATVWLP